MSALPKELLDVNRAREIRDSRWGHMLQTLRDLILSVKDDSGEWANWEPYFRDIRDAAKVYLETKRDSDYEQLWRSVKRVYIHVLMERDPETRDIQMPTDEEWDKLAEVLPEFRERYRIDE